MAIFLGFILGDFLQRVGFFRALGALLLLAGSSLVSFWLVARNVDPALARTVAVAVPLALFVWAIWNPSGHRLRLLIVDGVYLAVRLGMWLGLTLFAFILLQSGFYVRLWLERAWTWAVLAAVLWAVQWLLLAQVRRSARIMAARRFRAAAP